MRRPVVYVQNVAISIGPCSLVFAAAIAISIIFCTSALSNDNADPSEYILGPEDVIQLFVWQYDQFNGTMTVGPDGKVTVHLLGAIPVAGLTRQEVQADITKRLAKFIREDIEVTISIVEFRSQKISVFGAVRTPSTIRFFVAPSLLEVIMTRCIPTPDADLTAIMIMPKTPSTRDTITVNIKEILDKGNTSSLPELQPGDTVYVPRIKQAEETGTAESAENRGVPTSAQPPGEISQQGTDLIVHIMGAVNGQNSYAFAEEPTLTEALLRAGSVPDVTALRFVRIIRSGPTTGDGVVDVDFAEYLADGDASRLPKLYSGDTIYVPDVEQEKTRDISITITGQVLAPGTYRIYEPLNILDAISKAGGLAANADTENIRLRKETADSYQEKVVNIDEYLREVGSSVPPEMVEQGYSIYVPIRRSSTSVVATVVRGVVAFLADLALVYSLSRVFD